MGWEWNTGNRCKEVKVWKNGGEEAELTCGRGKEDGNDDRLGHSWREIPEIEVIKM
jgi:hypothetical protein